MKASQAQLTGTVTANFQDFFVEVPNLGLQSVTLHIITTAAATITHEAVLAICTRRFYPRASVAVLAHGVLTENHPLFWTGRMELGEGALLCAHILCNPGDEFILTTTIRDI